MILAQILNSCCGQNIFFKIKNSDPYRAVSWDRLHAYGLGLFGAHIWEEIVTLIKALGREYISEVDKQ